MPLEDYLGSIVREGLLRIQRLEEENASKQQLIRQQTQDITRLKAEIEQLKKAKK